MKKNKILKIILITAGVIIGLVALIIPIQLKLASIYTEKGNENLKKHLYRTAFSNYEKASALMPNDETLKLQLGKIYFLKNNFEEAQKEFQKAVEINENNTETHKLLIKTLLTNKKLDEAEKKVNKLPKKILEDKEVQIQRARTYAYLGKIDDSLIILNDNTEPEANFYKAVFLIAKKDFGKSEKILHDINTENNDLQRKITILISAFGKIKTSENETYKIIVLAETLNEIDEPYLAEKILKEVLEKNPDYRDALIFLGYSNYLRKDSQEARNYLIQAIEKDPIYGLSYYFLGKVDIRENKKEDARNNYQKSIDFGYKNKYSYKSLGEAEKDIKNYQKAQENFKESLKLDQKDEDILFELIEVLILEKKLDEAESLALKNEDNKILGWVYLEKDDLEKSLGYFKKSLEEEPYSAFINLKIGEAYKKQNKGSEAHEYFQKATEYDLEGKWASIAEKEL